MNYIPPKVQPLVTQRLCALVPMLNLPHNGNETTHSGLTRCSYPSWYKDTPKPLTGRIRPDSKESRPPSLLAVHSPSCPATVHVL